MRARVPEVGHEPNARKITLALRSFLGLTLAEIPADHSTLSRTRRLIDLETHTEIFGFVLKLLAERGLVSGKTIGIDATTLEANAAMKSIVRREDGESHNAFLVKLAAVVPLSVAGQAWRAP